MKALAAEARDLTDSMARIFGIGALIQLVVFAVVAIIFVWQWQILGAAFCIGGGIVNGGIAMLLLTYKGDTHRPGSRSEPFPGKS